LKARLILLNWCLEEKATSHDTKWMQRFNEPEDFFCIVLRFASGARCNGTYEPAAIENSAIHPIFYKSSFHSVQSFRSGTN
jgi:hypothetical protein